MKAQSNIADTCPHVNIAPQVARPGGRPEVDTEVPDIRLARRSCRDERLPPVSLEVYLDPLPQVSGI